MLHRHLISIACVVGFTFAIAAQVGACPPLEKENDDQAARAETIVETSIPERADPAPAMALALAPATQQAQIELPDRADLDWFRDAAVATKLAELLPSDGDYTIFIPTDDAYRALTEATKIALRNDSNLDNLRTILAHHIVKGRLSSEDLIGKTELRTLSGQTVGIDASFGGITIGRAKVIDSDIEIDGAVIHLIDKVLIPSDMTLIPDGPLLIGMYVRRPSSEAAIRLGINRSQTLRVTSLMDGANAGPAGVRRGDIILTIDGEPASVEAGERAKKNKGIGNHVELKILRHGETITILVPVGIDPR